MSTVPLESASSDLVALAAKAQAGEEVIFTDHERPVAKLIAVEPSRKQATPEMLERRSAALKRLRELDPFRDIKDPVAWQREERADRPLPDRE